MTLFCVANELLRKKKYEDAIFIYEHLAKTHPKFQPYGQNEMEARRLLASHCGNTVEAQKLKHLAKATEKKRLLRIADALSKYQRPEWIDLCYDPQNPKKMDQFLLAKASAVALLDLDTWAKCVNDYLQLHAFSPIHLAQTQPGENLTPFLRLRASKAGVVDGPLVSVCIACYNAERYVELAVRSILNQSYKNIEVFAFNDRSSDTTLEILNRLAAEDARLRVFDNSVNQGTYISRNQAFQMARGKYFTIHDADDFALSERIEKQVAFLENSTEHMGVLTEWLRLNEDGQFHFKLGWAGCYQHEAVATLMVRTHEVRERIGYWDAVKFSADTEFLFRLQKAFGNKSVPLLKIPSALSLYHAASLTNDPTTGISVNGIIGLSPTRQAYRDAWKAWHATAKTTDMYIPHPLQERKFPAPPEMLPSNTPSVAHPAISR